MGRWLGRCQWANPKTASPSAYWGEYKSCGIIVLGNKGTHPSTDAFFLGGGDEQNFN